MTPHFLTNDPNAHAQPVPYVQRGKNKYVVDHHHTLAALELFCKSTETDLYVTMERIRQFDKSEQNSLTDEAFWGVMEGKGWAFLRDENYNRSSVTDLPLDFALSSFRNDIYRSMGGFARVYEVLKRGKELDDMLFFEFRWGCAFFLVPFFLNRTNPPPKLLLLAAPQRHLRALDGQAAAARLPALRAAGGRHRQRGVCGGGQGGLAARQGLHLPFAAGHRTSLPAPILLPAQPGARLCAPRPRRRHSASLTLLRVLRRQPEG